MLSGKKLKGSFFVEYEWRLFYTTRIEKDDLLFLGNLENWEIDGYSIFLEPHIDDYPPRIFRVLILDEKREIDLHSTGPKGSWNPPNKGIEISFVNADPILKVDMHDPDAVYYAGFVSQMQRITGVINT